MRKLPGLASERQQSHISGNRSAKHDSAHLHVTGKALYIDDRPEMANQLHAGFGLSTEAHADIISINFEEVWNSPGVVAVITADDIPGHKDIGPVFPGDKLLADGRVDYIGQPVFAVAATSHKAAEIAARKAVIQYRTLDAILGIDQAMAQNSFVRPDHTMNKGDAGQAIANADHWLSGQMSNGGQEHFYLEGQIASVIPREAISAFNQQSPVLKKGLALTPVKFGISFTAQHLNQAGALVHVYTDGSIQINHGGTEMGQGLYTKVAQIVANEFGVSLERVQVTSTRTDKVPNTSPTAASSGTDLNGKAAQDACQKIRDRLVDFAVEHYGVSRQEVSLHDNEVQLGERQVPFADFIQAAYLNRISLSSSGFYSTPEIHYDRETKAKRFRQRLEHKGNLSPAQIEHMRCPVGLESIGGRKPAEIAIAIAAEILSIQNGNRGENHKKRDGIPWQGLKKLLNSHQHEVAQ